MTGESKKQLQAAIDACNAREGDKLKPVTFEQMSGAKTTILPTVVPAPIPAPVPAPVPVPKPPVATPAPAPAPTPVPAPVVIPPNPVTPTPVIVARKVVTQDKDTWAIQGALESTNPVIWQNEEITDGGGLLQRGTGPVTVTNCQNRIGNQASGGLYFIMLWPESGKCVSKATIDLTGCTIYESPNETCIRAKCDDLTIIGGILIARMGADGNEVKPVMELRSGKAMLIKGVTFQDGWPEIGQQWIAQPDGSKKLDTTQHIGFAMLQDCKFTRWTDKASRSVVSRKPGVDKIVLVNCTMPDGSIFSGSN